MEKASIFRNLRYFNLHINTMLRNTKVSYKSSEIFSVILPIFKSTMNLAHIKCLSMLLGALCTVQTVCLSKLAAAFDNRASSGSSFRRTQRFLAQIVLDLDTVARYLKSRIPFDGPYTLTIDRTNWKFGDVNINALVLGIAYDHMSFPILFRLLPKRWNSNFKERINIMERFIRLFGRDSIKCLVTDREFVGNEWFKWLNDNAIQYHIRIRDNFWVEDPRTGRKIRAQHIFVNLKHGEERILYRIYRVCGELCYLAGAVIKDKTGKHEPHILVSFCRPEEVLADYKEMWTIETMFKGLKSSGFNIEDTHMVHINRIKQLRGCHYSLHLGLPGWHRSQSQSQGHQDTQQWEARHQPCQVRSELHRKHPLQSIQTNQNQCV